MTTASINPLIERADWIAESKLWRGRTLTGQYSHWCVDWDFLPIDETTLEWPCACSANLIAGTYFAGADEKEDA